MRESYKYRLWNQLEKLGWLVIPIPASGAGRKGTHRPDLIIGNGNRVLVAEVKNCKLPLYLYQERDIDPVINFAKALSAEAIIILKKKFAKNWLIFKIKDLDKSSNNSFVINNNNIKKGIVLQDFLKD